jgi:lysophospholipase L1-like esterase
VPCENLLDNAGDDCASSASREDPDNVYPGDGANCQRRKEFHRRIRDTYNPIIRDVLAEYRNDGELPNARYTDLFSVRFESEHVNGGDCFHPSTAGHALFASKEWCETHWGHNDPACSN